MEQLLHYVWKHKMWPLGELRTTDGRMVEIINPGLHNRLHGGPDFFNAKIKIDGTLWVGNVEIHQRAADWFAHGHDKDAAYNNVVLHVVGEDNATVTTQNGQYPPQMVMQVPEKLRNGYEELIDGDAYPPCHKIIPELSSLTVHAWMSALQTERLEEKTQAIEKRVEQCGGSWEDAYFMTLARNYGFGVNSDAFEMWARHLPLQAAGKHRDSLFQIEALFMGQAGLLDIGTIPLRHQEDALRDGYFTRLRNEYLYLAHKFSMKPMDSVIWRFLRMRPQNFPHIRIAQLANLYFERHTGLSELLECRDVKQLRQLLGTQVTPYWETHYTFGAESAKNIKKLSISSKNLLIINTVVPMFFAVGRHRQKEELCDRAFDLMEQLAAENNHIIKMWKDCGLEVKTAGDSQALIQLKRQYCDRKDCLRCRIGYEYLKKSNYQA